MDVEQRLRLESLAALVADERVDELDTRGIRRQVLCRIRRVSLRLRIEQFAQVGRPARPSRVDAFGAAGIRLMWQGLGLRKFELSGKAWRVDASTERLDVLANTDYVINSIEVAGLKNVRFDYDIPMRYGVDQCIGDTIGPGGIFKALRTGPAWLDIVSDVQRIAPKAAILNYTNPMSILTLAALRTVDLPVVGLCHSVQGTSRQLADYLGIDYADMTWECAGI